MEINDIIRKRRSIFPKTYIDKAIPKAIIEEVLENANHAPTHKFTEPWRFKVFTESALQSLSTFMGEWYKTNFVGDAFSEKKYKKMTSNPLRSACVIAICMQRDPEERIPEWEEVAAVSCAVQNMWLTCSAHDIGSYWSSPRLIKDTGNFLNLQEDEQCLGFFYMGYHNLPEMPAKRTPISDKVIWM